MIAGYQRTSPSFEKECFQTQYFRQYFWSAKMTLCWLLSRTEGCRAKVCLGPGFGQATKETIDFPNCFQLDNCCEMSHFFLDLNQCGVYRRICQILSDRFCSITLPFFGQARVVGYPEKFKKKTYFFQLIRAGFSRFFWDNQQPWAKLAQIWVKGRS